MELPVRKPTRSSEIDYTQEGLYFITICTAEHRCLLSKIDKNQDLENAKVVLTPIGEIVEKQLLALEKRYPVEILKYVIMPNHIHIIISVLEIGKHLSNYVCALKSLISKEAKAKFGVLDLFQRSFFDRCISCEKEFNKVFEYIERNPAKWIFDRYYSDGVFV